MRTETSMGRRASLCELGSDRIRTQHLSGPLGNRTNFVRRRAGRMATFLSNYLNETGTGPVLLVDRGQERIAPDFGQ